MNNDKRRALRRPIRYSAWVALEGEQLHGCVLSDVSESGARIDIDETKTIPDQFVLLLASNGSARRKCRVMWRKPQQFGVTFDRGLTVSERTTLVPNLDADMISASTSAEPADCA